ncbi:unnamed protein product [Prorocentrum cordatum]|uniref:Uncharacterized protein n=1 Tax=Prorocentrum cordatum TaxID=2364126 RepID=A0ABN9YBP5_9DINO|nr:unnamed protein product [Polarella glacialis]
MVVPELNSAPEADVKQKRGDLNVYIVGDLAPLRRRRRQLVGDLGPPPLDYLLGCPAQGPGRTAACARPRTTLRTSTSSPSRSARTGSAATKAVHCHPGIGWAIRLACPGSDGLQTMGLYLQVPRSVIVERVLELMTVSGVLLPVQASCWVRSQLEP